MKLQALIVLLIASNVVAAPTFPPGVTPVHYVSPDGAHVAPFTTWVNAANDIQSAIDVSDDGDMVMVGEGHYLLSSQIEVNKKISIESANGPESTIIDGGGITRCFYLGDGACAVSGFTITNGYYEGGGGGIYCIYTTPVISNCVITGNSADYGGGMHRGVADSCIISGNLALVHNGGGTHYVQARNCEINGNWARQFGGGMYNGRADHCTIIGNSAVNLGGGMHSGEAFNSIIWYNDASEFNEDLYNTFTAYCCSPGVLHGNSGNITNAPLLVSASHISSSSPCIGAGSPSSVVTDIDGQARFNPPSIGCDEYLGPGSVIGEISISISGECVVVVDNSLLFKPNISGQVTGHTWDFGDGVVETNNLFPEHVWDAIGFYDVILTAYNDSYPGGVSATQTIHVMTLEESTIYVDVNSGDDADSGLDWETAKASIDNAVDNHPCVGGRVLVSNGVYNLSSTLQIDKFLIVQSVNGAEQTTVNGNGDDLCISLGDNCSLHGFTIQNGAGGIRGYGESSVIDACIVRNNTKTGIYRGTVYNSVIHNNTGAYYGGGLDDVVAFDCLIYSNSAKWGGGIDINFYFVKDRPAGAAYNCIIYDNIAELGGGVYGGVVENCLIYNNHATDRGGGFTDGIAINCTIVGNSADNAGGGVYRTGNYPFSSIQNTIIFDNNASADANIHTFTEVVNSCSPDLLHGVDGNITNAPLFVDLANNDFRLIATSPCIDAGANGAVTTTTDLDGNTRIVDGDFDGTATVDMGAYEFAVQEIPVEIMVSTINLKSKGRTPVAVITMDDFDASTIDPTSVRFAGASPVHCALEDIDGDGDMDLKLHFKTQELDIEADGEVTLMGQTYDGVLVLGMDTVKLVPKK